MAEGTDTAVQESWEAARRHVDSLALVSNMFSSCIRAMKSAEAMPPSDASKTMLELALSSATFLVSVSPTLKTSLYFAAKEFYPDKFTSISSRTRVRDLVGFFSASDLAAVLAMSFLFRHLRKRANQDEWGRFKKKLYTHMTVGSIIGETITHVGPINGSLIGGVRCLAMFSLCGTNLKAFQEMRRKLDRDGELFNPAQELSVWGCMHTQIASKLLQALGFGIGPSTGIALEGFRGVDENAEPTRDSEEALCWSVCASLTESFHRDGSAPEQPDTSDLYVPPDQAKELTSRIDRFRADGPPTVWVDHSKTELPPEILSQLEIDARTTTATIDEN